MPKKEQIGVLQPLNLPIREVQVIWELPKGDVYHVPKRSVGTIPLEKVYLYIDGEGQQVARQTNHHDRRPERSTAASRTMAVSSGPAVGVWVRSCENSVVGSVPLAVLMAPIGRVPRQ